MGDPKDRIDSAGNEKIQCRICHMWFHRLDVHLSKHKTDIAQYLVDYPGAPVFSEAAKKHAAAAAEIGKKATENVEKAKARAKAEELEAAANKKKREKAPPIAPELLEATAGQLSFGVARLLVREGLSDYDARFVPEHDERWIPGATEQRQLEELALAMEDDDNCLIVGPHGIGKSTLVIELAAICNQPLRRVGMDGDVRRGDFIGEKNIVIDAATGQAVTSWIDGVAVEAAELGHWLLIDEVDATPAHISFVLHGALEKKRFMSIAGDRGRVVKFHKNFRIIGTANTLGAGDESGQYAGTTVMNQAFLDRWGVTIAANYPDQATEAGILMARTGVEPEHAEKMARIAAKIREAHSKEECFASISTRRLIDWAQKTVRLGDAPRAAKISMLNKMGSSDAKFIGDVIQRYFGGTTF